MKINIVKRDGREVPFKRKKIEKAVLKAFSAVDKEVTEYAIEKACNISRYIQEEAKQRTLSIEDIQDLVEKGIMATKRKDVAKEYILYREERRIKRDANSTLIQKVKGKIENKNIENQNANVDEASFGGRIGEASNELLKQYALDYCVSKKSKKRHLNNEIYIHDLASYAVGNHNCLTVPFDDLLAKGFNTRQTDVRPANSINTAFQLLAVIFQLQSLQQFGGVAASHLDWSMIPYVRRTYWKHIKNGLYYMSTPAAYKAFVNMDCKDNLDISKETFLNLWNLEEIYEEDNLDGVYQYAIDMTKKETEQAVEGMYHNLNTLQSRSGNQLPFTSINFGTCTLPEGRLIIKALLDGLMKGVGALHKTSVFPCVIFQCGKGINRYKGDPNYDLYQLALKTTSKRVYPNYANIDWSGNAGYDPKDPTTYFATMGCRTANSWDINGFGQKKDGRGNICPVTIILPTIAMQAIEEPYIHIESAKNVKLLSINNRVEAFMQLLTEKIDEAKDMLLERFEYICSQPVESAKFMYENNVMAGYIPEEGIRSALKHGTLAIGQLGLAETLQILIGTDHTTKEGLELAKRIEELFKNKCAEFKQQYKLNFGVYYTPAENLCYTALKKFRDKYGIIPNVSDKEFFTNSMHVPVWREINAFEKIDIESQLTGFSSAGCITYVELSSTARNNIQALERLVTYAMEKDIPYFAINVPNDTCLDCGYSDEFNDRCPICHSENIQQLRRVTGYLTGNYKTAFNKGKIQETEMRVKHL